MAQHLTTTEWNTQNPILANGNIGVETDTGQAKVGDGVRPWLDLPYFSSGHGIVQDIISHKHLVADITDFSSAVRDLPMAGMSLDNASAVYPTDPLITAVGKLQAQVNNVPNGVNTMTRTQNATADGTLVVSSGASRAGRDYTGSAGMLKVNASGVASTATAGTDYLAPDYAGSTNITTVGTITSGTWNTTPTNTTATPLKVQADSLTTASAARIASNSADTTSRNILQVVNDHTGATGAVTLDVVQDAAQSAVVVHQNANAPAIKVLKNSSGDALWLFDDGVSRFVQEVQPAEYRLVARHSTSEVANAVSIIFGASGYDGSGYAEHLRIKPNGGITITNTSTATGCTIAQNGAATALNVTAANTTTASVNVQANSITTGGIATLSSNASGSETRSLLSVTNSSTTATGTTPLSVTQNTLISTNFKRIANLDGVTLYVGNGTTPNGNLSATQGDICFKGSGGQAFYCGGGTTWTAM